MELIQEDWVDFQEALGEIEHRRRRIQLWQLTTVGAFLAGLVLSWAVRL